MGRGLRIAAVPRSALPGKVLVAPLVGRRTLVLYSDQTAGRFAGCGETVSPSDPQLYVFAGADVHIVTTDGEAYWFPSGQAHPTADPVGTARIRQTT